MISVFWTLPTWERMPMVYPSYSISPPTIAISCMMTERRVTSLFTFSVTSSSKSMGPMVNGVPESSVSRWD